MQNKVHHYIDQNKNELFKSIQELVQIKSITGHEYEAQQFMRGKFEDIDLDIHKVQPDYETLKHHDAFIDSEISFNNRFNLVGIHRGKNNGRSLTLHGHVDVVSPGALSNWTKDPWSGEISQGKLYGRGAADMKSGLLANWFALKALKETGVEIPGDVQLHSVIEEEVGGGGGALACLESGFLTDGYISTEPHNLNVTISHAGVMYFRVKVEGKTAHAGLAHEGINSIVKMQKIIRALDALNEYRSKNVSFKLFEKASGQSVHLNIGVIKSGDWASTVPGESILECRISFIPGESREEIKALVFSTIEEAIKDDEWLQNHKPKLEWFSWSTEAWYQEPNHPLVQTFKQSAESVLEKEIDICGRSAANDARFTQYYGKAGICFGPIGHNIHGPDECVELDSVLEVTKILTNFILTWTGGGNH